MLGKLSGYVAVGVGHMSDKNDDGVPESGPQKQEELMASIDARFKQMEGLLGKLNVQQSLRDRTVIDSVTSFVSSGFFFLVLGGALLFVAQAYMSTNHAGITFVLVVLGVALLLYGTGTQGMGQFNSPAGAGYNVAIAGGAGIVAFVVAYGIIEYSSKMRDAFQPERKFVRVIVQGGDGLTDITQYASKFEIDGVPVPAARKGKNVEVYVPYLPYEIASISGVQSSPAADDKSTCNTTEDREAVRKLNLNAASKTISATFYRVEAGNNPDTLLPRADTEFKVRLDQGIFRSNDGGIDYPVYPVRICVNLQQVESAKEFIAATRQREIANPATSKLKQILPPALIEAQ
jgi:hypothetical protein